MALEPIHIADRNFKNVERLHVAEKLFFSDSRQSCHNKGTQNKSHHLLKIKVPELPATKIELVSIIQLNDREKGVETKPELPKDGRIDHSPGVHGIEYHNAEKCQSDDSKKRSEILRAVSITDSPVEQTEPKPSPFKE